MKEKISKEKILEYFEIESGDRLLDRFEYAERVIFPAMEKYARQFLNPIVADSIFELIGQGVYKINCCELTIGGLADQVEGFVNQEVEKRIAETVAGKFIAVEIEKRIADRFPGKEEILKYFNNHFNCHADVIIGDYETTEIAMTNIAVLKMFEWLRSRLTPQVTPQDTPQVEKTEGGGE